MTGLNDEILRAGLDSCKNMNDYTEGYIEEDSDISDEEKEQPDDQNEEHSIDLNESAEDANDEYIVENENLQDNEEHIIHDEL